MKNFKKYFLMICNLRGLNLISSVFLCATVAFAVLAENAWAFSIINHSSVLTGFLHSLGSICLLLLLITFPIRGGSKAQFYLKCIKLVLIFTVAFFLSVEVAILDFSGVSFDLRFFYHFEWQSLLLGLKEYPELLALLLSVQMALAFTVIKSNPLKRKYLSVAIFCLACFGFLLFFSETVVGRFYTGWEEYDNSKNVSKLDSDNLNTFAYLGVNSSSLFKEAIEASAPVNKQNVIVIYLESFSHIFTTTNKYPNLTPNINRFKEQFGEFTSYYSNAGFTMDGLISSNCGLIPNMSLGNNTFTDENVPFFHLPCASDVFKKVGYHQEFIGGAKKSFASKEAFLLSHSYNKVWGWEDFEDLSEYSKKSQKNWWGLHDEDLFKVAMSRAKELELSAKPFKLDLITIGTHLKGFVSPSCPSYTESDDKYLNAIFCTDYLLGQFIDDLSTAGILNNTTVFVTSDHGVFTTPYTRKLFTNKVSKRKILGLMLGANAVNTDLPVALYDVGAILLENSGIKHNASFVLGRPISKILSDRLLFTRSQYFSKNNWVVPGVCNQENQPEINQKPNKCTFSDLFNAMNNFTSSYSRISGIPYQRNTTLSIQYGELNKKIDDIFLNETSLKSRFRRNGFVLNKSYFSKNGLYIIFLNTKNKNIYNLFYYSVDAKSQKYLTRLIGENENVPFIVFTNASKLSLAALREIGAKYNMTCENELFCMYHMGNSETVLFEKNASKITVNL